MQRQTKLFIALGAAGIVGLSAAADVAFADRGRGHYGHQGTMTQRIRIFMERYDVNKDGRITQEEIDANRSQWHGEFDTDKNGQLSLQEFQALWLRARFEQMVREFQRFDRNGDAQVTIEEYRGPLTDLVERLDRNDDGALSRDDRSRRGMKRRGDSNGEQDQSGSGDGQSEQ